MSVTVLEQHCNRSEAGQRITGIIPSLCGASITTVTAIIQHNPEKLPFLHSLPSNIILKNTCLLNKSPKSPQKCHNNLKEWLDFVIICSPSVSSVGYKSRICSKSYNNSF